MEKKTGIYVLTNTPEISNAVANALRLVYPKNGHAEASYAVHLFRGDNLPPDFISGIEDARLLVVDADFIPHLLTESKRAETLARIPVVVLDRLADDRLPLEKAANALNYGGEIRVWQSDASDFRPLADDFRRVLNALVHASKGRQGYVDGADLRRATARLEGGVPRNNLMNYSL